jgi:hypothetical protein
MAPSVKENIRKNGSKDAAAAGFRGAGRRRARAL